MVGAVALYVAERHGLYQRQPEATLAAPGDLRFDLAFVDPFERHHVDLDGEARRPSGLDTAQHLVEIAPAGDRAEPIRVPAVEADVYPADPAFAEASGHRSELGPVGRHGDLVQPLAEVATDRLDESQDVAPDERLSARQADAPHATIDEYAGKVSQFFQCQQIGLGQELHMFGHAVAAAKIAPVGHRQADVGDPAAEAVDQSWRRTHHGVPVHPLLP